MMLKRPRVRGAIKVRDDGITFDSKAEHARYQWLKVLEKAGKIKGLMVHRCFPLYAGVAGIAVGKYEIDFMYFEFDSNAWIYEDVKGYLTDLSKWKIKHFEIQEGVKVRLIRKGGTHA